MKTKETFKLFDTKERCYLFDPIRQYDYEFETSLRADQFRHEYLQRGNYPDDPCTVIQIHSFEGNKFTGCIIGLFTL
jgi:hypothetical protein